MADLPEGLNDGPVYVNITLPIDQAWLVVDALRVRGMHEIAQEIIDAIDESVNVEIHSEGE